MPAGIIASPGVRGYTSALNERLSHDPAKARALLDEAGYPNGFSVRLDCPNNRYNNDEKICVAAVGMLAKIGIRARLDAQPKSRHFVKVAQKKSDFYMLGWGVVTLDSHFVFSHLFHSQPHGLQQCAGRRADRGDGDDGRSREARRDRRRSLENREGQHRLSAAAPSGDRVGHVEGPRPADAGGRRLLPLGESEAVAHESRCVAGVRLRSNRNPGTSSVLQVARLAGDSLDDILLLVFLFPLVRRPRPPRLTLPSPAPLTRSPFVPAPEVNSELAGGSFRTVKSRGR